MPQSGWFVCAKLAGSATVRRDNREDGFIPCTMLAMDTARALAEISFSISCAWDRMSWKHSPSPCPRPRRPPAGGGGYEFGLTADSQMRSFQTLNRSETRSLKLTYCSV